MRRSIMLVGTVTLAVMLAIPESVSASQREELLRLSWGRAIPEPGDPLMVYVTASRETRDQSRFDDVVMANESMLLAAKFFKCVELSIDDVKDHPIFADVKMKPPSMVAFDSTRDVSAVAGGRASGMKIYEMLCSVGKLDYETSIPATVREARNLLGSYDRIDAAQDAIAIKRTRLNEAQADNDSAKVRKLERDIEKDQAAIDDLVEKTNTHWAEIWDLKRKQRETAGDEGKSDREGDAEKAD